MKVFWLSKPQDERDAPLFRSDEEFNRVSTIGINEDSPFNLLLITNPETSNCICTINKLKLKKADKNIVSLFMCDRIPDCCKIIQANTLSIGCSLKENLPINSIELDTIQDELELIDKNYAILIPGGSLILETDNDINEAELTINYSIEIF